MMFTFQQKPFTIGDPANRTGMPYIKIKEEWFRLILPNGKRLTLHRSCYKFKRDEQRNIYPYFELEASIKKSKYLIRQWRHRRRK